MRIDKETNRQKLVDRKKEIIQRIGILSEQLSTSIKRDNEYKEPFIFQKVETLNALTMDISRINQRLFELK